MTDICPIVVENVSLDYRVPHHHASSLKETMVRIVQHGISYGVLRAVNNVTFTVERGEVVGIIGANGAGKSTLMKIMARVLPPSSGRVRVRGQVSPMIELGAGFNVEQTARENIILYGTLLGRDAKEMKSRCAPIVEWAGLEEYLDVPVRAFSSGMVARLAFAVAVDIQPSVLLIDEILSVGDSAFQVKSNERMKELIYGGTSVVIVSHSLPTVMETAHRVIWLDHGSVVEVGDPCRVVTAYANAVGVPPPAPVSS